jgi:hypothetical protein
VLDAPIPHITLQPNSARRLKTDSSERRIPLVGASLWAATQAFELLSGQIKSIYFLGIPRVVSAMLIQLVLP